ncbi:hypothetical protein ACTXT7_000651 [Hymenolepis weldensis]
MTPGAVSARLSSTSAVTLASVKLHISIFTATIDSLTDKVVHSEVLNCGSYSDSDSSQSEGGTRYQNIKGAVALGIRKAYKAVPKNGLLQKAKDYLKRQHIESTSKDVQHQGANVEAVKSMSSSSMLPPAPPAPSQSQHLSNGSSSNSRVNNDVEDSNSTVNLNDDSMMVLSQSVDALHTVGTAPGSDALDHQVRTLFVSGLPLDTKSRELYLLFRSFKPVGFVTFETREQAEHALNELQGIKFDPEGSQHMRLEFARSNTKVTKPKWPPGFPLVPGAVNGFSFLPAAGNPAGLSPIGQQAGFQGVLPPNFLPHLPGCKSIFFKGLFFFFGCGLTTVSNFVVDPATMALIAANDASQWAANPHFGYDTSGLFASFGAPATLLQASNFRPILPMNANGTTPTSQSGSNQVANQLHLVHAALQVQNALGLVNSGNNNGNGSSTAFTQSTAGATPQGSSPTGSIISNGNTSQSAYSALQNQQQFMAANNAVQQHQQNQQRQQQAAFVAAAASVGLPAGLLPGMLSGLATSSTLKDDHNQNGSSVAMPF